MTNRICRAACPMGQKSWQGRYSRILPFRGRRGTSWQHAFGRSLFVAGAVFGEGYAMLEHHFSWQGQCLVKLQWQAQYLVKFARCWSATFMAGAVFGEVAVSLFVASAALSDALTVLI